MFSKSSFSISRLADIMVDQAMLTALPNVLNAMPSVPPLLKAGVDLSTGLGQLAIADKIARGVPAPADRILKAAIEIEGITQVIEAIPSLISAFGSGGGFLAHPAAQGSGAMGP